MKYTVIIADPARDQMLANARWWAENRSVEQAIRWCDGFHESLQSLADSPHRHRLARENNRFPDELRDEMEGDRLRDPDKFAHVWLGQYKKVSGSLVFSNWTVRDFDTPRDAVRRFGADWGFAIDPTVLVSAFIGRLVNGGHVCVTVKDDDIAVEYELETEQTT